ncbi:retrovirus-related Pol polyprotein from transposon 297 [Trichonephila clavipes]|nr:retrovirus-related Pol polyprotein from transposon 297 [Trichonephila clavipes]
MSPVELPYVPILLDETFTKALWDTGAEKSFISEETYQKYFFYKQVKKSSTQVITAQGAECRNMGVVELNIRIRDFEKPWLFHVLADLEYPCILGIYFIDKPGLTHALYHEIDTGDNPPVVSRPYRYDRLKQEILNYHVDKTLKEGTIIHIQSPYASPLVLCRKNNGLHTPPDNPEAYRFAVDYRILNAITKYPRYPLPLIDDLIMNIPHTGIMSALDLRTGYFQMAVNPSDIVKTTFVTKNGTYAFRRMPFCLSGAAPNFQKAIDIILKPVISKFVSVYMDDVIISSPSFAQHVKHLKEVFRLLHEAGLTLNKEKCKFGCEELKYLGLIINKEGIKIDETKVQAIVETKPPHNSKEVSKFLGMSQWYAKFIKNYADICEPLYNLKRKLKRFIWSIEAQKAFDAVKAAIPKAPILKFPDFKKPFELFTDASSIGVGAVLNQEQRPVVFASRTLSAAERNYTVTERENV